VPTRLSAGVFAGLVLTFAAACGGGGNTAPTGGGDGATPRPPAGTRGPAAAESCTDEPAEGEQIDVTTHAYPPETKVAAGSTVTWTNNDDLNHTVTFRSGPRCGIMLIGSSYTVQFDSAGSYDYFCEFHSTVMKGKIVVE
jgi:plastocyanin